MAADGHVATSPDQMHWGAAPPVLPKGAELALLSGDPGKQGDFVMRLRMPDGYRVPPHWHSMAEHLTVISGTFHAGMGDKLDTASATALPPGGYAVMPAREHHYAWCSGGPCVVQIQGMGPFDIHYVNQADNPQAEAAR
jgi:anti-sigma factor ChrR (cupin superfamily)